MFHRCIVVVTAELRSVHKNGESARTLDALDADGDEEQRTYTYRPEANVAVLRMTGSSSSNRESRHAVVIPRLGLRSTSNTRDKDGIANWLVQ